MSHWLIAEDLLLESDLRETKDAYPEDYKDLTTNTLLREVAYDPLLLVAMNTDLLPRRLRGLGFSSVTCHRVRERVLSGRSSLRDLIADKNEWIRVCVLRVEIEEEDEDLGCDHGISGRSFEVVAEARDTVLPLAVLWSLFPRVGSVTSWTKGESKTHVETIYTATRTKAQSILLFLCGALRAEDEDLTYMTNHLADMQARHEPTDQSRVLVLKVIE